MSIADDYEKMLERIAEGRARIDANSQDRNLPDVSPEEKAAWEAKKRHVAKEIRSGTFQGTDWKFAPPVWVEFLDGPFRGRTFPIKSATDTPVVLVLYPAGFEDQRLFDEKFSRILAHMERFSLVVDADPNNLIRNARDAYFPNAQVIQDSAWTLLDVTHAIVFFDGGEHANALMAFDAANIPYRKVDIRRYETRT